MDIDHYLEKASGISDQANMQFVISKQWAQGRTVYGGLSAGMLYAAAKSKVSEHRVMRSMSTNFVGPLLSEQAFTISVEVIREGKSISQIQARAIQNEKVCVISQLCFGEARVSKVSVPITEKHGMDTPTKAKYIPQIPKVTPKFLRHFELSIDKGSIPFLGNITSLYHGWMRFKVPPKRITDAHIISIIDTWPPTILQMLKWPAPVSTVSWNIDFIHPHREILPNDWFAYQVDTRQAADGYAHTEATIWDSHKQVIALSRQTVAIFD